MQGSTAAAIVVTSPIDGEVIGSVPALGQPEIAAAIERAAAFQGGWGRTPWQERRAMLVRAREILIRRAEEIARLIAREQGKPVTEGLNAEIMPCLDALKFCALDARRHLEDEGLRHRLPMFAEKQSRVVATPMGVTSVLSAWNYPIGIPFIQIAYGVAVGNAVVFRPSSSTSLCGIAIGDVFHEAGVPEDALQVVTCPSSVAETLVTHPAVRLVLFTGSNEVGQHLMRLAADGPKKIVLELGGKDPFVVFPDADLERAARGAVWTAFMNAGQTCSSTERVYVHERVLEPFTRRVVELAGKLRSGDPLRPDVEVGPMTTEDGLRKVESQVRDAVERGARVLTGGERGAGRYYPPTVLADVTHEMAVMREETFGPLLPIMSFRDEDEAVRLANDCPYGLTASVWTRDRALARRMSSSLDAGIVTVNDANFSFAANEAPWGGPKASGVGRTHGRFGLEELVSYKLVSEDWSERSTQLWYHPYDAASYRFFVTALPALFAPALSQRAVGLLKLVPQFPRLAREASLPHILGRVPGMLRE